MADFQEEVKNTIDKVVGEAKEALDKITSEKGKDGQGTKNSAIEDVLGKVGGLTEHLGDDVKDKAKGIFDSIKDKLK